MAATRDKELQLNLIGHPQDKVCPPQWFEWSPKHWECHWECHWEGFQALFRQSGGSWFRIAKHNTAALRALGFESEPPGWLICAAREKVRKRLTSQTAPAKHSPSPSPSTVHQTTSPLVIDTTTTKLAFCIATEEKATRLAFRCDNCENYYFSVCSASPPRHHLDLILCSI